MWQIAQRDYKFGKGKHSSLTKATYDAVGNRFRSLWGKEAGWAHSVLFTADLRVFAERLSSKVEVAQVKGEEITIKRETSFDSKVISKKRVKEEPGDDSLQALGSNSTREVTVKRKRKT